MGLSLYIGAQESFLPFLALTKPSQDRYPFVLLWATFFPGSSLWVSPVGIPGPEAGFWSDLPSSLGFRLCFFSVVCVWDKLKLSCWLSAWADALRANKWVHAWLLLGHFMYFSGFWPPFASFFLLKRDSLNILSITSECCVVRGVPLHFYFNIFYFWQFLKVENSILSSYIYPCNVCLLMLVLRQCGPYLNLLYLICCRFSPENNPSFEYSA